MRSLLVQVIAAKSAAPVTVDVRWIVIIVAMIMAAVFAYRDKKVGVAVSAAVAIGGLLYIFLGM